MPGPPGRRGPALAVAAAAVTALLLLTAAPPGSAAAAHAVAVQGFAFKPATITVNAGDTVTWTNLDGAPHTVSGTGLDSGVLRQNGTFAHTFAAPGSFDYRCDIHPLMRGTVTVNAVAPSPVITPGPPVLSAPAPGATLPGMGTTLQWNNAEATTQVHLQVTPFNGDGPGVDVVLGSPAGSFAVPAPPNWYGLLPDMGYTWRVRTSTAFVPVGPDDGSWTPWSEAVFRTPVVSEAGISAVVPAAGATVLTLTPTLQWASPRADLFYFEVQLSRDATSDTNPATATGMVYGALVHGGVSQPPNSYTVPAAFPLQPGVGYSWRVRPRVQGDGTPAAWSPTFAFTTPGRWRGPVPIQTPARRRPSPELYTGDTNQRADGIGDPVAGTGAPEEVLAAGAAGLRRHPGRRRVLGGGPVDPDGRHRHRAGRR